MIDTSVWIALIDPDDTGNEKAVQIAKGIHPSQLKIFDHIYIETLTVLRNKFSELHCEKFIKLINEIELKISLTNEDIFLFANHLFFNCLKLSFTDCLLLASAKIQNNKLISFDKTLNKAWEEIQK